MHRARLLLSLLALAGLLAGLLPGALGAQGATSGAAPSGPVVVRLYYGTRANLDAIAAEYDVWEVHHDRAYLVAMLSPQEYQALLAQGYRMEVDLFKTMQVRAPLSIPGYPCYRTVEETYTTLQDLATTYPTLAELYDIGDSWAKIYNPPGYDIYALRISNEDITPLDTKPTFFLMAEIHAREYTTAETATRLAEYILQNYGTDPVVTFFVDYSRIFIVPMVNPDGRKHAEQGEMWRKNVDNDDGCTNPSSWGTDLNRNSSFKWNCCGGSSGQPCAETYHGPSRGSEPEVQAIQDYVLTLFPDQNGPNGDDEIPPAAPDNATGIFITLHSYQGLVLWPWGFQGTPAPNGPQLQTIGTKLSTYNGYTPQQAYQLYVTDGTTDDWSYGKLGIASFTFEMGYWGFFESCSHFENDTWPGNRPALLYAWKIAQTPYMTAYGPDALNPAANPNPVQQGDPVQLTATINDSQNGNQQVAAAEYYVLLLHGNTPPGDPGTGTAMDPADGNWNTPVENVVATVDTSSLTPNSDYIIALRGKDANDNWGPFTAVFLHVGEPAVCEPVQITGVLTDVTGCVATFEASLTGSPPFTYTWDFGAFGSSNLPTLTVDFGESGTYPYTLTVTNCVTGTDTYNGQVTVYCCTAPYDTAFTYAPPDPLIGQAVAFTGTASGTLPISYTWDFGDDQGGSGVSVTHTYTAGGDYTVVMTASNGCGAQAVTDIVSVCRPASNADFFWNPIHPNPNEWVAFHGSADGSTPLTYAWDFGDGQHGSGANVSHRYPLAGIYTVVMTATNCAGDTSVATHNVTVGTVTCDPVDITGITPDISRCTVTFSADLSGTAPFTYLWAFGDGVTSTLATPTHDYSATGSYSVTLDAWNCPDNGNYHDSYTLTIAVDCTPVQYWYVYLPLVWRHTP
jgi:carboxypeptidase T